MKWFVVLVAASLARFGEGGALRCPSGSQSPCSDEKLGNAPEMATGKECAAGTFWQSQCNECGCSPKGYSFCTEKACADDRGSEPIFRCAPNSQWKNECNTCRCTSDGQPACTDMLCGKESFTLEKVPEIGEEKKNDADNPGPLSDSEIYDFDASVPILKTQREKIDLNEGESDFNLAPVVNVKEDDGFLEDRLENFDDGVPSDDRQELSQEEAYVRPLGNHIEYGKMNMNGKFMERIELKGMQDYEIDSKEIGRPEYSEQNIRKREETPDGDDNSKHFKDNVLSHSQSDQDLYKTTKINTQRIEDFKKGREREHTVIDQDSVDHNDEKREAYNIHDLMKQDFAKKPLVKRSVCKPNQPFQSECNSCKCASDGLSYTCTHNECMEGETNKEVEVFMESEGVDHIERHSVCKPTATFYIGCNTCHCNYFGNDYSCTNKPCPLPEDVELFHELKGKKPSSTNTTQKVVCVANRMFIMDCNTCWCNEDGTSFFCTRKVCAFEFPEEENNKKKPEKIEAIHKSSENSTQKIVCVANRMFVKDCNTCWCNEDGTGFFCTRKVCVPEFPEDETSQEKLEQNLRIIKKECRPDEVFEIDCNMCRCNPDGLSFSCTRRACVSQIDEEERKNNSVVRRTRGVTQEPPKACQPGQEFRMDCNTCLCDNEGQDFSCTRNDCNAVNGNKGGVRAKRESIAELVAMECNAGSVFDIDCNVCRCTDGHQAMCTTKRCNLPQPKESDVKRLPGADPDFRCNPGEQFKRGCNDCSCSADGKSEFCTVRFCDDITPPPPST